MVKQTLSSLPARRLLIQRSSVMHRAKPLHRNGDKLGDGVPCKRWSTSSTRSSSTTTTTSISTTVTTNTAKSSSPSWARKLLGDEAIIPCSKIMPLHLKESPTIQDALPFIGNIAYLGIASGFLMTDMLQLRVLLVGGYSGLVIYHILRPNPLRIPLRWSALFVAVNAGAACFLLADQYMAPLSEEDRKLYQEHFSSLTPGQFYQLMRLGTRQEIVDQQVLTVEAAPCSKLFFIERGQAKVYHHKAFTAKIEAGGFVNDVAFQRGENEGAYGTIVASGPCSVIIWDQAKLRDHLSNRAAMDRNLKYLLSDHLVKSLLRQREAAHLRQRKWNINVR